jgi:FkbM family methyltransferase
MVKSSPGGNERQERLKIISSVIHEPDVPLHTLMLAATIINAGHTKLLGKPLTWASVNSAGVRASGLVEKNIGTIVSMLRRATRNAGLLRAAERFSRSAPASPDIWHTAASLHGDIGDPAAANTFGKRALSLRPDRPLAWLNACPGMPNDFARRWTDALRAARRASVAMPLAPQSYRLRTSLHYTYESVDALTPKSAVNDLKRWIILEHPAALKDSLAAFGFRRFGDWRRFVKVLGWSSVTEAAEKGGQARKISDSDYRSFAEQIASLAPYRIDCDFPARPFRDRVLLHPRLPNDGPWTLHGPAEFQERALRVLSYANPSARILSSDAPDADLGRPLSLVPSDDPETWFLPCLWGHWHVWWTVMPAVLNAEGQPDLDLATSYGIRTRQNVTFWYPKGHERRYIAERRDLGRSIAERLGDAASRESYLETMAAHRPTFLRRFFTEIAHRVQYFDYAVYRPGDVVLNLGVSEGFEVPAYLALIGPTGTLHNIDPEGYQALGAPARAWIEGAGATVVLHECALSDVDGEIEMETGGCWEDARISKRKLGNLRTLPAKRLDTFIAENRIERIDHIKLDIEGGEGFLLDQLIEVMRSHRPQIEISIYHTVEQFFDIPDRMMRESQGYRFFFHHYCGHFGEGTLYAIPEEIEPLMPIKP